MQNVFIYTKFRRFSVRSVLTVLSGGAFYIGDRHKVLPLVALVTPLYVGFGSLHFYIFGVHAVLAVDAVCAVFTVLPVCTVNAVNAVFTVLPVCTVNAVNAVFTVLPVCTVNAVNAVFAVRTVYSVLTVGAIRAVFTVSPPAGA